MTSKKPPSTLENVSGGLATEIAFTLVAGAGAAATPLAVLLPVLSKSLAAERQKQRVNDELKEINIILENHQDEISRLSDQQYKLINETIVALFHTTNEQKMKLLRNAVMNSLRASELNDQDAVALGRVIRDISVEETTFLVKNFGFDRIWLSDRDIEKGKRSDSDLSVKLNTVDGQNVLGLFGLGLVSTANPSIGDLGLLRFTPLAAKLIAFLKEPS